MSRERGQAYAGVAALVAIIGAAPAAAGEYRGGGKLLLTSGVSSIEGAAGGGLATWAFIAGNETDAGIGAKAYLTYLPLSDYAFTGYGAAIGLYDRLELSVARQRFGTGGTGTALGLGRGFTFGQDIFGAKLRIFGDGVYAQDSILPQISIGVQHKRADKRAVIRAIGGRHAAGTDYYVAASKLLLRQSLVLDVTARLTKANQTGLLGFGGDAHRGYSTEVESSAAYLVSRRLALGAEYRMRPDNLGFAREDDAWDLFAAYALTHSLSFTAAYADLGAIATVKGQHGAYLSLQASF